MLEQSKQASKAKQAGGVRDNCKGGKEEEEDVAEEEAERPSLVLSLRTSVDIILVILCQPVYRMPRTSLGPPATPLNPPETYSINA